jgi:hypothetical protein
MNRLTSHSDFYLIREFVLIRENLLLQYYLFMQNEPNFPTPQIHLSPLSASDYAKTTFLSKAKNEPNRTQFEPNFNPIKPKTNPICWPYLPLQEFKSRTKSPQLYVGGYRELSIEHRASVFFNVEGLGWECELDGFGVEALQNFEIDLIVKLVESPPVGRFDPINDVKIQRAVVELAEIDAGRIIRVGIDLGDGGKDFFDELHGALGFVVAGVVGDGDICLSADERPFADVFDDGVSDDAVRDGDEVAVPGADSGASESDFLDEAAVLINVYEVVNLEGSVGEDGDGAEEVGDGFFRGECNGDAAYAGAEEDALDVLVEDVIDDEHRSDQGDSDSQGLADDGDEHIVELCFCFAGPSEQVMLDDVDELVEGVGDGDCEDGLCDAEPACVYGRGDAFDGFGVGVVEDEAEARQVQAECEDDD